MSAKELFHGPVVFGTKNFDCSVTFIFVNSSLELERFGHQVYSGRFVLVVNQLDEYEILDEFLSPFERVNEVILAVVREKNVYDVRRRVWCSKSTATFNGLWAESRFIDASESHADFSCKRIRAVAFPFEPYTIIDENGDFRGLEVRIFKTIIAKLGITSFSISRPSDGGLWGEERSPGNFTGLMGDLQRGVADVGWAQLFIIPNRVVIVDYTSAYDTDYLCYMVAKPEALPAWTAVVLPFEPIMWLSVVVCYSIAILATLFLVWFLKQRDVFPYVDCCFYVFGAAMDESLKFSIKCR